MKSTDPNLFGDTVVALLEIKMHRSGVMSIGGSITDEASVLAMIDTARATLVERFRADRRGKIIVPAYDTALVGTDMEKKLLRATDQLHRARDEIDA
jgi:hypothetical protein